jgi:hypothetical protein
MQVENQTRKDIDGKKLQLRQTVGQSYHELITAASIIQTMADECKTVVDDLASIRGVFADLAKALTATRTTPAAQQQGMSDAQLELYGMHLLGRKRSGSDASPDIDFEDPSPSCPPSPSWQLQV